ncbi:hypothetical protein V6N13_065551 [Hibiscus sabdariffa]
MQEPSARPISSALLSSDNNATGIRKILTQIRIDEKEYSSRTRKGSKGRRANQSFLKDHGQRCKTSLRLSLLVKRNKKKFDFSYEIENILSFFQTEEKRRIKAFSSTSLSEKTFLMRERSESSDGADQESEGVITTPCSFVVNVRSPKRGRIDSEAM